MCKIAKRSPTHKIPTGTEIYFKNKTDHWSLAQTFQVRPCCDPRLATIKTFPILEASSLILPFPQNFNEGFKFLSTLCKKFLFSGYFVDFVANGQICREPAQTCFDFHEFPKIYFLMNFVAFAKKLHACSIALYKQQVEKSESKKFQTKRLPWKVNS